MAMLLLANPLIGITLTPTILVPALVVTEPLQTVQHIILNCLLHPPARLAHLPSSSQSHTHTSIFSFKAGSAALGKFIQESPLPSASIFRAGRIFVHSTYCALQMQKLSLPPCLSFALQNLRQTPWATAAACSRLGLAWLGPQHL